MYKLDTKVNKIIMFYHVYIFYCVDLHEMKHLLKALGWISNYNRSIRTKVDRFEHCYKTSEHNVVLSNIHIY